jgi:hypothetical protein
MIIKKKNKKISKEFSIVELTRNGWVEVDYALTYKEALKILSKLQRNGGFFTIEEKLV